MRTFEVLEGLPGHGPMYVPITDGMEPYYSEGFVVRFFPERSEPWVANFKPGLSDLNTAYDFPQRRKALIIAGGEGYVMSPEHKHSLLVFGGQITAVLVGPEDQIVMPNNVDITVLTPRSGSLWRTRRISWDGFQLLRIEGNSLHGESWQPTSSGMLKDEWRPFRLDLNSRQLTGGSYPMDQFAEQGVGNLSSSDLCGCVWDL